MMKILLLAMPDAANNFHRIIKVPNLGLCSIAAHLKLHEVKVVDLVLVHRDIQAWLQRFLHDFRPDVVGISSMSFQYDSAVKVMSICRACVPQAKLVLGGYHATLSYRELTCAAPPFDYLVRGEGEQSFADSAPFTTSPGSPGAATAPSSITPPPRCSTWPACRCRTAAPACWTTSPISTGSSTASRPRAAAP
jgi:hypothetical protein